jgi:penicillin-binding protein 1A
VIGRIIVLGICLGLIGGSAIAVWACSYVVEATAADGELLDLDNIELSQSSIIYAQHYDTTGAGMEDWYQYAVLKSGDSHRLWVDLEEIPKNLQYAFICTEDKEFETEHGVNFKRTIAAAINEYTPLKLFSSRQGASTIEQQLIKNLLSDDSQGGLDGVKRKLREIYRAWGLDNKYSKSTILEAYLNTISFTGTLQGVETASQEYFGKHASDLTLAECATIASITKNPTQYNPYTNPEMLLARRHVILRNMLTQGKISQDEYDAADAEPLTLAEEDTTAIVATTSNNSYFTDALFEQLTTDIMDQEGLSKEAAQKKIYTGGLQIYATVDPDIQTAMENIMLNTEDQYFAPGWHNEEVLKLSDTDTPVYNDDGTLKTGTTKDGKECYYRKVRTQASMATLDFAGNVLALVGGLGEKTNDLVLNRAYDVPRQTGSTMKPIGPYSLGIEYGLFNWSSMIDDAPLYTADQQIIADEDHPGQFRDWPSNYEGTYSLLPVPLYLGLAKSMNTIAVRVGDTVGPDNIFNFAHNTLQLSHLEKSSDDALAPMVLGSQHYGVTTVELAAAYQIFDNGTYTTPHLYSDVYNAAGDLYLEADTTSYQALTPQTAMIMNRLLRNVLTIGTAAGYTPKAGGMEAVGKTGTASDYKDYAFVGLTPYYATACWWGFDNPYDMRSVGLKNNTPCKKAWKDLMEAIQGDLEYRAFPTADGVVQAEFCNQSGLLATDACADRGVGYYKQDDMPPYCDLGV